MAEVHVSRYSLNRNIKSFQNLHLADRFTVRDPDTHVLTEYTFKDHNGNTGSFNIGNGGIIKLNKNNPIDAHNIASLKVLEKNMHLLPPNCLFQVIDLDENTEIERIARNLRIDALLMIRSKVSQPGFLGSVARRLGMPGLQTMTADEVQNKIEEVAETKPELVMNIMTHHNQTELFEIDKAKELGTITNQNGFYYYGQTTMGINEAQIISFFQTHPDIYDEIRRLNAQRYGQPDSPQSPLAASIRSDFYNPKPVAPVANGVEAILKPTPATVQVNSEQFFSEGPVYTEPLIDETIVKLIDDARRAGVLAEQPADNEDTYILVFNNVPLTDYQAGEMEDQAGRMLSIPANAGLVKQITKALTRARA